jgi:predicted transcriptional regulator of viral defense system
VSVDVAPRHLADELIGRGRHFVTTHEVGELLGVDIGSVRSALRRSIDAGAMLSITKGAWIPVPPEYRSWGAPPPTRYIDRLMRFLEHPYYVGFLSAAQIHGASHQSPMVFQVVTPAVMRDRHIGRSSLQFIRRAAAVTRTAMNVTTPTGRMLVSTPEVTLFDLVDAPSLGGGLSNVATIAAEFLEAGRLDPDTLVSVASLFPTAVRQRLGYLIDVAAAHQAIDIDLTPLADALASAATVALDPHGPSSRDRHRRWHVRVNATIDIDQ